MVRGLTRRTGSTQHTENLWKAQCISLCPTGGTLGFLSEFSSRTAWICRISPDVLSKTFEQMRQPTLALFLRLAGRQNPPGPPVSDLWSVSGSERTLLEAHGECDYRKRPPRHVPGAKRAALGDASPPLPVQPFRQQPGERFPQHDRGLFKEGVGMSRPHVARSGGGQGEERETGCG